MHSGSTRNREDDVDYLYPESGDESSVDDGSSDEEAEGCVTEKVDTDKEGRQVIIYCGKSGGSSFFSLFGIFWGELLFIDF